MRLHIERSPLTTRIRLEEFDRIGCSTKTMASFDLAKFQENDSSYQATEEVIESIRGRSDIKSYRAKSIEYLYNEEKKTAIVLKCIARSTTKQFRKRTYKKTEIVFDIANRCTTVSNGAAAIRHFFIAFPEYDLAISCGSMDHESCVFFRQDGQSKLRAIYYNPNFSEQQEGVQFSKMVKELFVSLRGKLIEKQAFYEDDGNVGGNCSGVTWKKLYELLCDGESPFDDGSLQLEDYRYNTTASSHHRYQQNRKVKNEVKTLKHHDTWEPLDRMLAKVDTLSVFRISVQIATMIAELYIDQEQVE